VFWVLGWWLGAMLGGGVLWAQTPVELPLPAFVGTRAVGMGEAFVAVANDAAGASHNPAGLGVGRGVALFGQANLVPRAARRFDPKGIAYRLDGVGWAWVNKIAMFPDGIADYTYVSAGFRVASGLAVGMSAKMWRTHPSRHFQVLGNSATYDLGILAAPASAWRVGGRAGTLRRGGGVESVTAGVARRLSMGWVALDADWSRPFGLSFRVGAEAFPARGSAFRVGWNGRAPAFGVGIERNGGRLDVAWTRSEGEGILFLGAELSVGAR